MDQPPVPGNTPSSQPPVQTPTPEVTPPVIPPVAPPTPPVEHSEPPQQPSQPDQSQPQPHPHQHHYVLWGTIALVVLLILAGSYVYFVLLKQKSTGAMMYKGSYTVPTPQLTPATTAAYENPFVSPTQAYSNPFDASASSAVTDTPYQNPFGN